MKFRLFFRCIILALVLALLLALPGVQPASAVAGFWIPTGQMTTTRDRHTATLLLNGKVLVVGGEERPSGEYRSSADLYDPATGTWTATGSMAHARLCHTATLLPNGKVMVAGGGDTSSSFASAELYDPATGLWTSAGTMVGARCWHTATLLANGKVLVVGGSYSSTSAELYDPATNTWSLTGSMNIPRAGLHAAVRLLSGEVLVMAGNRTSTENLKSAELYDPATGMWTATGSMVRARMWYTATLLSNGTVLVAGGSLAGASAELYDPATGVWTETGSRGRESAGHTATLLPDGKVLAVGGRGAELYDPETGTWTAAASMGTPRDYGHTAVLLQNGKVLVAGGASDLDLASAELYSSAQVLQRQSNSVQDGWVLETSETSNQGGPTNGLAATFLVGDNAGNRQYRSILSFNTGSLPDHAVIASVVLKIKKHSLTGTDPFSTHGRLVADIRQGPFYRNALQPEDFQAAASQHAAGMFQSTPLSGDWYIATLKATAHAYINRTGVTQFRLRFQRDDDNDAVADFLRFYSGDAAAADRPVLLVEYYVP